MLEKKMVAVVVLAILLSVGTFYVGRSYERSFLKTEKAGNLREGGALRQGMRPGGERSGLPQAGVVAGEVIAKDDQSITVKTREGGSKIIYYSASTTIGKTAPGSAEDLLLGQDVMVNGSGGSDGSLSAQNIQIRPEVSR